MRRSVYACVKIKYSKSTNNLVSVSQNYLPFKVFSQKIEIDFAGLPESISPTPNATKQKPVMSASPEVPLVVKRRLKKVPVEPFDVVLNTLNSLGINPKIMVVKAISQKIETDFVEPPKSISPTQNATKQKPVMSAPDKVLKKKKVLVLNGVRLNDPEDVLLKTLLPPAPDPEDVLLQTLLPPPPAPKRRKAKKATPPPSSDEEDEEREDPPPPPEEATLVTLKTARVASCCGSADKNEIRAWCRAKYGKKWFEREDKKEIMSDARKAIFRAKVAE